MRRGSERGDEQVKSKLSDEEEEAEEREEVGVERRWNRVVARGPDCSAQQQHSRGISQQHQTLHHQLQVVPQT